ncbi:hypothetical protein ES332_A05G294500v1 [Gossypium tomentosum]|uniref:Uncharacterized protein n=1 Tax=Gossypium tomentosum TaxID=34277 RepID=A0A5D2QM03_GOSTO|nr:hypothetical protein ES332_A05G294500v1 [Gossypium tomentosum]
MLNNLPGVIFGNLKYLSKSSFFYGFGTTASPLKTYFREGSPSMIIFAHFPKKIGKPLLASFYTAVLLGQFGPTPLLFFTPILSQLIHLRLDFSLAPRKLYQHSRFKKLLHCFNLHPLDHMEIKKLTHL